MNRHNPGLRMLALILMLLALQFAVPVQGMAAGVEVRQLLDTSALGDPFVYDVDPSGAVLVLTRDNIYDAGAREFLFGEPLKNPGWLAFAGGRFQFLTNGALFVSDGGMPKKLLDVPLTSRMLASDSERTFISGITPAGKPVLFLFQEGKGYKPLLELDAPIDAMALARGALFFSVGQGIYSLREGGPARRIAQLPGFPAIASLAIDERQGLLYFSEGENLYALRGSDFVVVRRGLGGMLRCRNGDLYVLSWRDHALFRVRGLAAAFASAGTLVPLKDPCRDPVMSLYCKAEEKRALLTSLAQIEGALGAGDDAARKEMDDYRAAQKNELDQIMAGLEKEAGTGAIGIRWGGGLEPRAIGANDVITTARKGVGITLWNGSESRIGPDSKSVIGECRPRGECRQTLTQGLLYVTATRPGSGTPTRYRIVTESLGITTDAGRFAVFAFQGQTAVVVIEGRVEAVTPQGESVMIAAGETLEARRGERPGVPAPAEMKRLNRWWEDIR